jgi:hypothetical protein
MLSSLVRALPSRLQFDYTNHRRRRVIGLRIAEVIEMVPLAAGDENELFARHHALRGLRQ